MRPVFQLAAILACGCFFILQGCGGGDDGPSKPNQPDCSIDIESPVPGTTFMTGQPVSIHWDAAGGGEVRISLLKGDAELGEIRAATDNDGYYSWTATTMGAASGTDFTVAVTHTDDSGCGDLLNLELINIAGCAITPTFVPAGPSPALTIQAGNDLPITWDSEHTSGNVDIEFWYYTGAENDSITTLAFDEPDDGEFLWEDVDSYHLGTSNNYFIRIADAAVDGCAASSAHFRIEDDDLCSITVNMPNSLSVHDEGDPLTIRFDYEGDGNGVDLHLYEGLEKYVDTIEYNQTTVGGVFVWPAIDVPDAYDGLESSFRVKIVDADDDHCFGFSQKFTIRLDK